MGFLNEDIPEIQCWIRAEYLYNLESHFGTFVPCVVFGVASLPGRAIMFHCLLETGAVIWRMPLNAFVHKKEAPNLTLQTLELWDAFSENVSVHEFGALSELKVRVLLRDEKLYDGSYLFTVDWFGNAMSDNPGDWGHKCAHVIKLDNGCFAAQPNNRIFWREQAFVVKPMSKNPGYKTNQHIWKCEDGTKWVSENTDKMFYRGQCDKTIRLEK
jgi:hypothetical protein